jgi:hypothetical protein
MYRQTDGQTDGQTDRQTDMAVTAMQRAHVNSRMESIIEKRKWCLPEIVFCLNIY